MRVQIQSQQLWEYSGAPSDHPVVDAGIMEVAMNRISKAFAAIFIVVLATSFAGADQKEDVVRLYRDFVSAQNAHDLKGVRRLLSDSPDFLWVSDGKPVWGADAMVRRMSTFQASDVWRVEPALDRARAVSLSSDVAFLHLPLVLEIGAR
ncbi:MAG: nuclear transport factor 2 family protein, partial [Rhodoblastus sp.]|nr:nuclear transport factor 2 family protein [Rhodoblastus sp.]